MSGVISEFVDGITVVLCHTVMGVMSRGVKNTALRSTSVDVQ